MQVFLTRRCVPAVFLYAFRTSPVRKTLSPCRMCAHRLLVAYCWGYGGGTNSHELNRRDIKGFGDHIQFAQGDVALARFIIYQRVARNADHFREFFLGHVVHSPSRFFDVVAEDFGIKFKSRRWLISHVQFRFEYKVKFIGQLCKFLNNEVQYIEHWCSVLTRAMLGMGAHFCGVKGHTNIHH